LQCKISEQFCSDLTCRSRHLPLLTNSTQTERIIYQRKLQRITRKHQLTNAAALRFGNGGSTDLGLVVQNDIQQ
jgi:hypothetical protein